MSIAIRFNHLEDILSRYAVSFSKGYRFYILHPGNGTVSHFLVFHVTPRE